MNRTFTRFSAACAGLLTAGSLIAAIPVAHADGYTKITPAVCKTIHKAVDSTGRIPDANVLRLDGPNSLQGDTLHLFADTPYDHMVHKAAESWTAASGGKIKFVFHDAPGPNVVHVHIGETGGALGRAAGIGTANPEIIMNAISRQSGETSLQYSLAHEIGHQLGLAHGCAGDLMKAGTSGGGLSITPTATDVAAVLQGNPAFGA